MEFGVWIVRDRNADVEAKAVTHPMQQAPDDELRGCIFPADSAHIPTAPLRAQSILALHDATLTQRRGGAKAQTFRASESWLHSVVSGWSYFPSDRT